MATNTGTTSRRGLSVDEVADTLGVSPDTVRNLIRKGTLRAIQPGGNGSRVIVRAADVDRLFGEDQVPEESGTPVPSAAHRRRRCRRLALPGRRRRAPPRDRGSNVSA